MYFKSYEFYVFLSMYLLRPIIIKGKYIFGWRLKKIFRFLSGKTLAVFLEKACGVEFWKHGGAVNFSRVVGWTPHPRLHAYALLA